MRNLPAKAAVGGRPESGPSKGHKRKSLRCSKFSLFYLFDDLVGGVLKRERNGQVEHL
jgi:hypothetical protein